MGSPFIYLVRFAESGRDAQPERQGIRRDLAGVVAASLPGARVATASGRLIVESECDACPSCRTIYWRGDHCERILERLAGMRSVNHRGASSAGPRRGARRPSSRS